MTVQAEVSLTEEPDEVIVKSNRSGVEKRGIDLIPPDERRGTPRQIGLMWSGVVLNVQVVVYGALLVGFGLNWWQCVAAIAIGNLTWVITGLCSLAGPAAGTTTFAINRAPFGTHGNRPIAFFNWIMQLGYEVLDLVLMTLAVTALFGIAGITLSTPATIAIALGLAVIQSILPIIGHAAITKVLRMLMIPFAALFLVLAWLTASKLQITQVARGGWTAFLSGIALAASASGLGWTPNAADYSRYLRPDVSKRALVAAVAVGGALPQCLLMLLGVAVAMVVPAAADPISGLPGAYPVWFVVPYLVLLIVQMITLNAVDLYSSGVTLQAIGIRIGRWQAVVLDGMICAVVGLLVVLSGSFSAFVGNFLLFMIVWFAPWAAVFVIDYFLRRGRYDVDMLNGRGPGFVWPGIAAQAAGIAVAQHHRLHRTARCGDRHRPQRAGGTPRRGRHLLPDLAPDRHPRALTTLREQGDQPMIPLIDLSRWRNGSTSEKASLAKELDAALQSSGFLMLSGHGVGEDLREDIRHHARRFFNLPADTKRPYETTVGGRGWVTPGREVNGFYGDDADKTLPDLKESYTVGRDYRTGDPLTDEYWFADNVWLAEVPELKALCDRYADAVREVYADTLQLCAAGLGLPVDWFTQRTARSPHTFNINRYPPLTQTGRPAAGQFRVAPHTDWGVLTILDRQVGYGGLEVQLPEGDWVGAPHVPGAFTVNIGDLMARWTGDRWRSTRHRVLPPNDGAPDEGLISLIMFCEADVDSVVTSLPAPIGRTVHPSVTAGDYLLERASAATIA